MTFHEYLNAYKENWRLDSRRHVRLRDYRLDRSLYTTWDISYRRLEDEDADAARLLMLMAYFDNKELWFALFQARLSDKTPSWLGALMNSQIDFENAMGILVDYCFVEVQDITSSYSLHNCVHDWIHGALKNSIEPQLYWYAVGCVANNIDDHDQMRLSEVRYARVSQHGLRLAHKCFKDIRLTESDKLVQLRMVFKIASLLRQQQHFASSELMHLRALAGFEKELGPKHSLTLDTINNLGVLYADQGELPKAEHVHLGALVSCERELGNQHSSTLDTLNNLGLVYTYQGKLSDAELLFLRALAGYGLALGPRHESTLNAVNNLGLLYSSQDKLSDAEQLYIRALTGKERVLGSRHGSTLGTMNNLGVLYARQGKLEEAEQMLVRTLAGYEKVLSPDHSRALQTMSNLGRLHAIRGKLAEAEQMYVRALAGKEKVLGSKHASTLKTIKNIGLLYSAQGKSFEAAGMILRSLLGKEQAKSPSQKSSFETIDNFDAVYEHPGESSRMQKIHESLSALPQEELDEFECNGTAIFSFARWCSNLSDGEEREIIEACDFDDCYDAYKRYIVADSYEHDRQKI